MRYGKAVAETGTPEFSVTLTREYTGLNVPPPPGVRVQHHGQRHFLTRGFAC